MPNPSGHILQVNTQQIEQFAGQLQPAMQSALDAVWQVLLGWGAQYLRMVQRVTPVGETGQAHNSWVLVHERTATKMELTLGSTIKGKDGYLPYVAYLEFGTDRIAGGRVKAWQPGDAPIMSWPAKSGGLPTMPRFGTPAYERYLNVLDKAFTTGEGEQMPMLRPIGYEIAPKIMEDVGQALTEGFVAVVAKRKAAA